MRQEAERKVPKAGTVEWAVWRLTGKGRGATELDITRCIDAMELQMMGIKP